MPWQIVGGETSSVCWADGVPHGVICEPGDDLEGRLANRAVVLNMCVVLLVLSFRFDLSIIESHDCLSILGDVKDRPMQCVSEICIE